MLIFITGACEKVNTSKLDGEWTLIQVSCECYDPEFDSTAHVWCFDSSNDKVTVVNKIENNLQILPDGVHKIELTKDKVKIQSVNYDCFFENNFLFLSGHPELDGPLLKFKR